MPPASGATLPFLQVLKFRGGGTLKNGGSPPPRVPTRMEPALASEVAALVDRLRRALDANTAAAGGGAH